MFSTNDIFTVCMIFRFVDRDMVMRYHWGLGVGHIYSRRNSSTPPTTAQSDGNTIATPQSQNPPQSEATAANPHCLEAIGEGDDDKASDRSVEEEHTEESDHMGDESDSDEDSSSGESDVVDKEDMYGDVDPSQSSSYD